jgi:hypothetical protein
MKINEKLLPRRLAKTGDKSYAERMNIVALQLDIVWENKPANFEKVRRLLGQSNVPADSLLCCRNVRGQASA